MAVTFHKVKNNAYSTLASGITDVATSLTVATGEGARFPSTFPFYISIDSEILECTNRVTDVLTVTRGAQGTSPAAHSTGAAVKLYITAGEITEIQDAINLGSRIALLTATIVHYLGGVSSSKRTGVVSSVSGAEITLTANVAYKWFNALRTSGYSSIYNETKAQLAWVSGSTAVNKLTVTAAADIATWALNDVVNTSFDTGNNTRLDVSQLCPAGATAAVLFISAKDTGTLTGSQALSIFQSGGAVAYIRALCQVSGYFNDCWGIVALDSNRRFDIAEVASGADLFYPLVRLVGYLK